MLWLTSATAASFLEAKVRRVLGRDGHPLDLEPRLPVLWPLLGRVLITDSQMLT